MKRDQNWDSMKPTALANVDDTKEKDYYYTYTCPRCQAKYTLDELTR